MHLYYFIALPLIFSLITYLCSSACAQSPQLSKITSNHSVQPSNVSYNTQRMQEFMIDHYNSDGEIILNAWLAMLERHRSDDSIGKIYAVNDFFNKRIIFSEDIILWKQDDYWATPLETMGLRAGDCEDFTIAKYMSLIELGIPPDHLRLIYAKAKVLQGPKTLIRPHMVLGYYSSPTSQPLILDNLVTKIESVSARTDLSPIYSFNREGLWIGTIADIQVDATSRLSPWRDVLKRMSAMGF